MTEPSDPIQAKVMLPPFVFTFLFATFPVRLTRLSLSRIIMFRWTAARKLTKIHRHRETETRTKTRKRLEWKTLHPIRLYWGAR